MTCRLLCTVAFLALATPLAGTRTAHAKNETKKATL